MKITRFEDILGWQAARKLEQSILAVVNHRRFRNAQLARQMKDCAGSIMANIAEGFDAGSDPEFVRFLKMAFRSATELQSHAYCALDERYVDQPTFDSLYAQAHEAKALIGGMMKYLKKSR